MPARGEDLAKESLILGIDWSFWSTVGSLLQMLNFFSLALHYCGQGRCQLEEKMFA